MTGHLTSQQVIAYRAGVSEPDELLRADDHLAVCDECRSLLAAQAADDTAPAIRLLQADFSSPHLTESQLDAYAARRPIPADLLQHLDLCPECRADADDLRQFVESAPSPNVTPVRARPLTAFPAIAALVVAALGIAAWFAIHSHTTPTPQTKAPMQAQSAIPPQYQAEVQSAIESGTLHIPASITGMTGAPIQLRSETKASAPSAFRLISPTATAVIDDTPVFRWTPLAGATYTITVYDDHFNAVASAASLHVAEWHPDKPLPRGGAYLWEVRAVRGAHIERAPAATEPEARFAVLSTADAQRLATARAAMPHAPLALGILYADAGALDDAKSQLEQAAVTADPKQKSTSEKLLSRLK